MDRLSEAERWLVQALRDLEASKNSARSGFHEWACFQAQQAAEKAVKALLHGLGRGAWGHSVRELLEALADTYDSSTLLSYARELDRHYMPSRYPNLYESGHPAQYYDEEASRRAISHAEAIIRWVQDKLRELGLRT